MAKKAKSKVENEYKPIESKTFIDRKSGYHLKVFRGTDADMVFDVPHWMNGAEFRAVRRNMKTEIENFLNYNDEPLNESEDVANLETTSLD